MWWGIFVIACGLEYGYYTIFSAIFITLCIRFLSGVPFPEEKYKDNEEWKQYCRETNVFCLWFANPEKEKVENEDNDDANSQDAMIK